jgi:hypothetical protein
LFMYVARATFVILFSLENTRHGSIVFYNPRHVHLYTEPVQADPRQAERT